LENLLQNIQKKVKIKVVRSHVKYLLILLAGTTFSAYLFYSINGKYIARNRSTVETARAKVEVKLLNELDKIDLAMESMEVLMKNSDTIYFPTFQELTTPFLEDLNGVLLLGWKPVTGDGKSTGYLVNNTQRPDIIKIHRTELLEKALEPLAELALLSRRTVFSGPVPELYDTPNAHSFLSMVSVHDSTGLSVRGVAFGVFNMDELVKETLRYELPILQIAIFDRSMPGVPLFVENVQGNSEGKNTHLLNLNVANRIWEVALSPRPGYFGFPHSYESYFVLLLGLFSSGLLVLVIKQRDGYLGRLSLEVLSRTEELERSIRLKETLLREIHHRVKNNLQIASSLMNMQKRRLTDPDMIDAFTNSQGRIYAIALIHEKIYEHHDAKAVDLKSYLRILMKYHQKISPKVQYHIDCPELAIDLDTAVPIALIASEIVVNALKHAYAEGENEQQLNISVREHPDGEIELSISDNGVGLPNHFDLNNSKGIGFEIVKKLCRQINAKFSFDTAEKGTTFSIQFQQKQ